MIPHCQSRASTTGSFRPSGGCSGSSSSRTRRIVCRVGNDAELWSQLASLDPSTWNVQQQLTLLASDDYWRTLPPHFGTKGAMEVVEGIQAAMPSVADPVHLDLPHLDLPHLDLPHLELGDQVQLEFPNLQLPADLLAKLDTSSITLPQGLPREAQDLLQPLTSGTADFAQVGASLGASLDSNVAALLSTTDLSLTGVEPHFGTHALQGYVNVVTSWLADRLSSLQEQDPEIWADFSSALGQLKQVATIITLQPPGLVDDAGPAMAAIMATLRGLATSIAASVSVGVPGPSPEELSSSLSQALQGVQAQLATGSWAGHDLMTLSLLTAAVTGAVAVSTPDQEYQGVEVVPDDPLSHDYSPQTVAAYYRRRPVAVARRAAQVSAEAARFGAALLLDLWTGKLQANEPRRAAQLRGIIERLGPAYVKVAQALSTRVDLLSPAYFEQITLLQDRVPPFPTVLARAAMEQAFGRPVETVFSQLSEGPIAAASLGQVYRATLVPELGGGDVAVKVLRPGVLEQVALDLYLMRHTAVVLRNSIKMSTDWAAVIDNWAVRFFHEMDYLREARSAQLFAQQMAALGGIVVADVVEPLSSQEVLTTAWVEGEKLSESAAPDVRALCTTLLNAYLVQLLDTGLLHADPHPGNLIRTPEGKICILDFGLMTEVTEEQRWALMEYIAHLSIGDWEGVAQDLQKLGFIPPEVDPGQAGLVEPLGAIMSQLVGGGGAAKINIDKVMDQLSELGKAYPFQVPPFFALILRAFSVIEGIALAVDPDYAIVQECFPYLSRRLLADDHPRAQRVLRDLLYGGKQRLDVERLLRFADGFGAFTTDGLTGADARTDASQRQALVAGPSGRRGGPAVDPVVRDALTVVFSQKGSYVQELLVEEMVAAIDAMSREALSEVVRLVLGSLPATIAATTLQALGPLRGVLMPVATPVELLSRLAPAIAVTESDREALNVVRGILLLLQRLPPQRVDSGTLPRFASAAAELSPLLPQLLPGMINTSEMVVRALLRRAQQRLMELPTMRFTYRDETL